MPRFSAVANTDELCRSLHFCSTFPSAQLTKRLPNMHQCENTQLSLKQVKILIIYIRDDKISNNITWNHKSVIQVVI